MKLLPILAKDAYKLDHRRQYPSNSKMVFSNMTARGTRVEGLLRVVFFGLQYFIKEYLINRWNKDFFEQPIDEVCAKYKRRLDTFLGPNEIGEQHIRDLHGLGHLPLKIMALPEGSAVNLRVPMLVIWNTHPAFFWLTNALETVLSATLWGPCTSATTAALYRQKLDGWCEKTDKENMGFVPWQGHDFSFRGHFGVEAAIMSASGHLLSFTGTDTVPAVEFLEEYYGADCEKELIGGSVAASEHSVASLGTGEIIGSLPDEIDEEHPYRSYLGTTKLGEHDKLRLGELLMFKRLITEVYPRGIVSVVMDTFDFWNVINPNGGVLVTLKDVIMTRDGKTVIRPDSGDPVKVVAGWPEEELFQLEGKNCDASPNRREYAREVTEVERKGLIECLWEIFGGTTNAQGYKILDPHIGAIYGDSITLERAEAICQRLHDKGFASTNLVYGIGSFTYCGAISPNAIITRDTHGFAVKSTYGEVEVDGKTVGIEIFKDPVTDDGLKKSAKGLTAVYRTEDGKYHLKDQATWEDIHNCSLQTVFEDGKEHNEQTLSQIRERLASETWD